MSSKSEYTKLWRARNKTRFKASEKSYYQNNKEQILVVKARYELERKSKDLNYKLRKNLRSRLSTAVKRKSGSAVADLGCSIEEFRLYIESKFQDGMTWDNWGIGEDKWQIDHIKPLFSFDLTSHEELKIACHYTNLQPLWSKQHINKSTEDMFKFTI